MPALGLIWAICTRQAEEVPPVTVEGFAASVNGFAALIVNVAVEVRPLCFAVIVEVVFVPTETVVTVNVAVVAPSRTVTDAGTVAFVEEDVSATETPPAGAAVARVIVPVEDVPPVTVVGLSVTVQLGTLTVSVAVTGVLPFAEAPMVLVVVDPTVSEVTVKVVLVAPAGTVTVAGTVAADVLLDVTLTGKPPTGAALPIVIVPVEGDPPVTVVGFKETPVTTGGFTVRVADWLAAPVVALLEGVAAAATATVVTVNVVDVEPAGTVTEAGTVAAAALDVSVTTFPPVGAGPLSVTVAVEDVPPVTVVGLRANALTVGAATVSLQVFEAPPLSVPVMVTSVFVVTAVVVAVKVTID